MAKAVLAVRNGDAALAQPVGFGDGFGTGFGRIITVVEATLTEVVGVATLASPSGYLEGFGVAYGGIQGPAQSVLQVT